MAVAQQQGGVAARRKRARRARHRCTGAVFEPGLAGARYQPPRHPVNQSAQVEGRAGGKRKPPPAPPASAAIPTARAAADLMPGSGASGVWRQSLLGLGIPHRCLKPHSRPSPIVAAEGRRLAVSTNAPRWGARLPPVRRRRAAPAGAGQGQTDDFMAEQTIGACRCVCTTSSSSPVGDDRQAQAEDLLPGDGHRGRHQLKMVGRTVTRAMPAGLRPAGQRSVPSFSDAARSAAARAN